MLYIVTNNSQRRSKRITGKEPQYMGLFCHVEGEGDVLDGEAVAAGIIEPYWIKGKYNTPDIMTKQIPVTEFRIHCDHIYWCPTFTYTVKIGWMIHTWLHKSSHNL
jgi:hypothetical protein